MLCALLLAGTAQASALPWGKEWARGHKLPKPYGIGVDAFEMKQGYDISALTFSLPGAPAGLSIPTDLIDVRNRIHHKDVKFDAWVLPFLNLFAVYGQVGARTDVDLSAINTSALGLGVLGKIPLSYTGSVYGLGTTVAVGGDSWFASVTGTWTRTSLTGDFASSVSSRSLQPRLGLVHGPLSAWVGAHSIEVKEDHEGTIKLTPALPPIQFAVSLQQRSKWSSVIGARYAFNDSFFVTAEYAGGDRHSALVNAEWRFGDN
jgi:hypothetical protein